MGECLSRGLKGTFSGMEGTKTFTSTDDHFHDRNLKETMMEQGVR